MNEIKFKRKASNNNGSVTVNIPAELAEFAGISFGDEVTFMGEKKNMEILLLYGMKSHRKRRNEIMAYRHSMTYYCRKCKHTHHTLSKIGKEHMEHANEEVKKIIFKKYGLS